MLPLIPTAAGTRFAIRVMARAARAGVAGVRDGRLVVRVTAPPVDGAANEAVVRILAEALDVPPAAVRISSGQTNRNKIVEIAVPLDALRPRIDALASAR